MTAHGLGTDILLWSGGC